jgi:hypothetical protein
MKDRSWKVLMLNNSYPIVQTFKIEYPYLFKVLNNRDLMAVAKEPRRSRVVLGSVCEPASCGACAFVALDKCATLSDGSDLWFGHAFPKAHWI